MQGNKISAPRGKAGEDAVCEYLKDRDCEIIARNYRVKGGEIDIIAQKDGEIIFCEVKARKFGALDGGAGAMTKEKMKRIIMTAESFIAANPQYDDCFRRFDTAYVTLTSEKFPRVLDMEYFEGDFTALDI